VPLSGLAVLALFSSAIPQIIFDVVSGSYSFFDRFLELVICCIGLLLLLPFLTTAAAGFKTGARRWNLYNLGAWVLVLLLLFSFGIFSPSELNPALWGAWLYRLLAAFVVIWQAVVLLRGSTQKQKPV